MRDNIGVTEKIKMRGLCEKIEAEVEEYQNLKGYDMAYLIGNQRFRLRIMETD